MKTVIDAMWRIAIAKLPWQRYIHRVAHTKPADLLDLSDLLADLRKIPGIVEKKPGIFYRKGGGFLHFHDKDGIRWADVKEGGEWKRVELGFQATAAEKKRLLAAARRAAAP